MISKKKNQFLFLVSFSLILFFISCEEDIPVETDTTSPVESVQKSVEIDLVSDNISVILEEAFIQEESISGRNRTIETTSFLPPCLTKTVIQSGMTRTVTLDFGNGCDMPNGNHLSGIITMVYERDASALTRTITYSFTDFYFNNKNIEGGGSIFRERANTNGNPQSTKNQNITITWPDDTSAHRVGVKTREWVEGFGSGTWGDNVFLITGNWTTEFPNTDVNTGIVTTPLRRELACRFIVSGEIALSHNNQAGTLNFGEGSCDNTAVYTNASGEEHVIILD